MGAKWRDAWEREKRMRERAEEIRAGGTSPWCKHLDEIERRYADLAALMYEDEDFAWDTTGEPMPCLADQVRRLP